VGDRRGEATTLHNIGHVWSVLGENQRALEFYELALPLRRAVGDRRGEGYTLHGMSFIYESEGNLDQAIACEEASVQLLFAIEDINASKGAQNLARLKSMRDGSTSSAEDQATQVMQQLTALYAQGGEAAVRQMLAGQVPDEVLDALIAQLAANPAPTPSANTLPAETVQQLCQAIVAVMTVAQPQRDEWRGMLQQNAKIAQQRNDTVNGLLFDALLAVLDGQSPTLPSENPYHEALQQVVDAIQQHK